MQDKITMTEESSNPELTVRVETLQGPGGENGRIPWNMTTTITTTTISGDHVTREKSVNPAVGFLFFLQFHENRVTDFRDFGGGDPHWFEQNRNKMEMQKGISMLLAEMESQQTRMVKIPLESNELIDQCMHISMHRMWATVGRHDWIQRDLQNEKTFKRKRCE